LKNLKSVTSFKSLQQACDAVAKIEAAEVPVLSAAAEVPVLSAAAADTNDRPVMVAVNLGSLVRGPTQGVGVYAKSLILQGLTNKEVLAKVLAQFPTAKTSSSCIAYYRSKLVLAGLLIRATVPAEPTTDDQPAEPTTDDLEPDDLEPDAIAA
jgi:hypothetical protein